MGNSSYKDKHRSQHTWSLAYPLGTRLSCRAGRRLLFRHSIGGAFGFQLALERGQLLNLTVAQALTLWSLLDVDN
jgi:hypothetical protein